MPRSLRAAGLIVAALAVSALAQSTAGAPSASVAPVARSMTPSAALIRAPLARPSAGALRALREGESLDLNRAQVGDLQLLPGVGPKLAARIVTERTRRGGFQRIAELREVKGIGPTILSGLTRFLHIAPSATDRTATPH
jgi:competence ComEA-like helix-hairpin-helix protein